MAMPTLSQLLWQILPYYIPTWGWKNMYFLKQTKHVKIKIPKLRMIKYSVTLQPLWVVITLNLINTNSLTTKRLIVYGLVFGTESEEKLNSIYSQCLTIIYTFYNVKSISSPFYFIVEFETIVILTFHSPSFFKTIINKNRGLV